MLSLPTINFRQNFLNTALNVYFGENRAEISKKNFPPQWRTDFFEILTQYDSIPRLGYLKKDLHAPLGVFWTFQVLFFNSGFFKNPKSGLHNFENRIFRCTYIAGNLNKILTPFTDVLF